MNISTGFLGGSEFFAPALEASCEECKREVNKSNRLANDKLTSHPRPDLLRLQPAQFFDVIKRVPRALKGAGVLTPVVQQDIPQLTAPGITQQTAISSDPDTGNEAVNRLSASAEMTALVGKITQLMNDSSLQKMATKLKGFNAIITGSGKAYSDLATELEVQGMQWAGDADALTAAQKQGKIIMSQITMLQSALDDAQKRVSDLQASVEPQSPSSDILQKQLAEASEDVDLARSQLNSKLLTYENHVSMVVNPAIETESISKAVLNHTSNQAEKLIASLTVRQHIIIQNRHQESEEGAKSLTFLIALMSTLINQNAGEDFKAMAVLKQKLSQGAVKDAEKKAQEYEVQVRKAQEIQKSMGVIGRILGWFISIVSVVAAVFTGGASLIFATMGVALMMADEIDQAVNNHSFMQDAMQQITESIIQPLIKIFSDIYATVFKQFMADKALAEEIANVIAAIVVAVTMLATLFFVGAGASKIFATAVNKIGSGAVGNIMRRVMDSTLGQALTRIGQIFPADINKANSARLIIYSRFATVSAGTLNAVLQAGGSIHAATVLVEAAKARAQLMKNSALQQLLENMLSEAQVAFSLRLEAVSKILDNISSIAENQQQAGKYITQKMSHVAG